MVRCIPVTAFLVMVFLLAGAAGGAIPDDGYIGVQVKAGPDGKGILVIQPLEDAPAAKAGVKADDLILKVDGKEVNDLQGFIQMIRDTKVDTRISLLIQRDGKEIKGLLHAGKSGHPFTAVGRIIDKSFVVVHRRRCPTART